MSWIENNRKRVEDELVHSKQWKFFSPIIYSQYMVTLPLILNNVRGDLIDVGCGRMPFRDEISKYVTCYDGLDIYQYSSEVKYVCDAHDMSSIEAQRYDSAICLEVLEHTKEPAIVLKEINRILKPGGIIVVSVPHLSRLHDIPHDYYRYTRFGISFLLQSTGYEIIKLQKKGGIFSFIGHQISTILLTVVIQIPILREIFIWLNQWLITRLCFALDQLFDENGLFACGYAVLAKKNDPI